MSWRIIAYCIVVPSWISSCGFISIDYILSYRIPLLPFSLIVRYFARSERDFGGSGQFVVSTGQGLYMFAKEDNKLQLLSFVSSVLLRNAVLIPINN